MLFYKDTQVSFFSGLNAEPQLMVLSRLFEAAGSESDISLLCEDQQECDLMKDEM